MIFTKLDCGHLSHLQLFAQFQWVRGDRGVRGDNRVKGDKRIRGSGETKGKGEPEGQGRHCGQERGFQVFRFDKAFRGSKSFLVVVGSLQTQSFFGTPCTLVLYNQLSCSAMLILELLGHKSNPHWASEIASFSEFWTQRTQILKILKKSCCTSKFTVLLPSTLIEGVWNPFQI